VTAGDERALSVLDGSLGDAGLTDADLDEVRKVLEATGARAVVEAKVRRLVARGLRHLDAAPLDPEAGSRLRGLLRSAADGGRGGPGQTGYAARGGEGRR
jgi:geranylgeranyl diphosphate synthase type I